MTTTSPTTDTTTNTTKTPASKLILAALERLDAAQAGAIYEPGWYSPKEIIDEIERATGRAHNRSTLSMALMRMRDAGNLRCHQQVQERPTRVIVNTYALPSERDTRESMHKEFAASQEAANGRLATIASTATPRLKRASGTARQKHGMRLTPRLRVPEVEWERGQSHARAQGQNMTEYVKKALEAYNRQMDERHGHTDSDIDMEGRAALGRLGLPPKPSIHEYATSA